MSVFLSRFMGNESQCGTITELSNSIGKFLISILCKNLRNWQEVGHDMSWNLLIFIYMAQLTPNIVNPSIVYHWWYRLPWKRVHPNFRLGEPVNLADFCLTWGKISAFLITRTTLVSILLYSTSCCVKI